MKKSVSMLELIFVIVILGILAAVAVPKLTATRDDAYVSRLAHQMQTAVFEIAAYVTAKGIVENNLSLMSNQIKVLEMSEKAILGLSTKEANITVKGVKGCLTVGVYEGVDGEQNITVTTYPSTDSVCKTVQDMINPKLHSMRISGQQVQYE